MLTVEQLRKVHDTLMLQRERLLQKRYGMTNSQYDLLMAFHIYGQLRVGEVAKVVGIPAPQITGVMDRLEAKGLLQRDRDKHDRRAVRGIVPEDKAQVVEAIRRDVEALEAEWTSLLAPLSPGLQAVEEALLARAG